tara:strand:- start:321 stop:533 length:213 start_codon:yes stop_codon:yes gene_type:complete
VAIAMRDAGGVGPNCINWKGVGQTGIQPAEQFIEDYNHIDIPLICALGIGNAKSIESVADVVKEFSGVKV